MARFIDASSVQAKDRGWILYDAHRFSALLEIVRIDDKEDDGSTKICVRHLSMKLSWQEWIRPGMQFLLTHRLASKTEEEMMVALRTAARDLANSLEYDELPYLQAAARCALREALDAYELSEPLKK